MKPHMAHMQHTMKRKQAANEAGNVTTRYQKYRQLVDQHRANGVSPQTIIDELESERERIKAIPLDGDTIQQQGMANIKTSCFNAIDMILAELKGEK